MTEKGIPNPQTSKVQRVRDNQRRCRARKKEYTASLEARLRDLEKKGAQASVVLQQQARKVLAENCLLRGLLTEKFRMSAEDIDAYLRIGRNGNQCGESAPSAVHNQQASSPAIPVASCSKQEGNEPPSLCEMTRSGDGSSHSSLLDVLDRGVPLAYGSDQVYASSIPATLSDAPESTRCPQQVSTETAASFDWALVASSNAPTQPEGVITLDDTTLEDTPHDNVASPSLEQISPQTMSDETIMTVMCSTPWPLPPSPSPAASYTSCTFAYQLLKAINERRFMPMNMSDVITDWLWFGFRASNGSDNSSAGRCCVVDDGVLYSAAVNLLE
ncbi:hypothetical protein EYR40_011012 [Pleurotus pulmonarius]|nr:hypothetical protein EYR36_002780 [Pleurotus pulmonarius]KAF4586994.1 hypothetical protein EYR40_011012 [Pleurotus pulmonarius]